MNLSFFSIGTSSQSGTSNSIFVGKMPMFQHSGSKSAQDKAERQQKAANQVMFWENKKENLKNTEYETLEGISRKLEQLRTYEDEISAAKMAYNNEQMWHTLDEAKERGEKIAEEAEKLKPKTAEERREEMAEEALEPEKKESLLEELSEEMTEMMEELQEQKDTLDSGVTETMEQSQEEMELSEEMKKEQELSADDRTELAKQEELKKLYRRLDIRI